MMMMIASLHKESDFDDALVFDADAVVVAAAVDFDDDDVDYAGGGLVGWSCSCFLYW